MLSSDLFLHVYYRMNSLLSSTNTDNNSSIIMLKAYDSIDKKGQLSLTNPRDASETFARFM